MFIHTHIFFPESWMLKIYQHITNYTCSPFLEKLRKIQEHIPIKASGINWKSVGHWEGQSRNSNLPKSSDQPHLFMAMLLCQSSRLNGHFTEALNSMRWGNSWGIHGEMVSKVTITSQLLIKPTFGEKKKAISPFTLLPSWAYDVGRKTLNYKTLVITPSIVMAMVTSN